jgi:hypothetical protein
VESTFLSKLAPPLQLLGKETWSTRTEHLEAVLFEGKPHRRHFGGNKQWSRFIDTDGVAMTIAVIEPKQASGRTIAPKMVSRPRQ